MKLRMKPEKKILATGRILESREGFILFFLMVEHLLVPEILCPQLLLLGFLELVSFLFWSKITSANKRLKTHEECSRRSLPRDSPWIAVGRYLHHARLAPPNKDYMPSEIGNVPQKPLMVQWFLGSSLRAPVTTFPWIPRLSSCKQKERSVESQIINLWSRRC